MVKKRWLSDEKKHRQVETIQMEDEQSKLGSMPETGSQKTQEDTLETAQEMGLYEDQDEEHPGELGVDLEVDKDEKKRI